MKIRYETLIRLLKSTFQAGLHEFQMIEIHNVSLKRPEEI